MGEPPAATPGDADALTRWPFWRANQGRWPVSRCWTAPGAGLAAVPRTGGTVLVGVGRPEPLARLLTVAELPAVEHAMLTRGTWDHVPPSARDRLGLRPGRPWDWLRAQLPPSRQPGEDRVVELTGADRLDRVYACLDRGYPERGRHPADAEVSWWAYALPDGAVAGVVGAVVPAPAHRRAGAGVHLQALAVDPDHRRRGVAAAITAALTRWGLGLAPLVHLGIWSDNDAARRIYGRLGYTTAHHVENLHPGSR